MATSATSLQTYRVSRIQNDSLGAFITPIVSNNSIFFIELLATELREYDISNLSNPRVVSSASLSYTGVSLSLSLDGRAIYAIVQPQMLLSIVLRYEIFCTPIVSRSPTNPGQTEMANMLGERFQVK